MIDVGAIWWFSRIKLNWRHKYKSEFRRSIVSARELNKGEIIKYEDLDFKRPATGLAPEDIDFVIGRKIKRKVLKDYPIKKENLE